MSGIGGVNSQNVVNQPVSQPNEQVQADNVGNLAGHDVSVSSMAEAPDSGKVMQALDKSQVAGEEGVAIGDRKIEAAKADAKAAPKNELANTFENLVTCANDFSRIQKDLRSELFTSEQMEKFSGWCEKARGEIYQAVAETRTARGLNPDEKGLWNLIPEAELQVLKDKIVDILCGLYKAISDESRRLDAPLDGKDGVVRSEMEPFKQGNMLLQGKNASYMASVANSLLRTEKGTALLNSVIPNKDHPDCFVFNPSKDFLRNLEFCRQQMVDDKVTFGEDDIKEIDSWIAEFKQIKADGVNVSKEAVAAERKRLIAEGLAQNSGEKPIFSDLEIALHLGQQKIAKFCSFYSDKHTGEVTVPLLGQKEGDPQGIALLLGLSAKVGVTSKENIDAGGISIFKASVAGDQQNDESVRYFAMTGERRGSGYEVIDSVDGHLKSSNEIQLDREGAVEERVLLFVFEEEEVPDAAREEPPEPTKPSVEQSDLQSNERVEQPDEQVEQSDLQSDEQVEPTEPSVEQSDLQSNERVEQPDEQVEQSDLQSNERVEQPDEQVEPTEPSVEQSDLQSDEQVEQPFNPMGAAKLKANPSASEFIQKKIQQLDEENQKRQHQAPTGPQRVITKEKMGRLIQDLEARMGSGASSGVDSIANPQSVNVPPTEQQVPVPPIGQQIPVPPIGPQIPVPPIGQQIPVPPIGQQIPVPPIGQQIPVPPTEQQIPVPPIGPQVPVPPTEQVQSVKVMPFVESGDATQVVVSPTMSYMGSVLNGMLGVRDATGDHSGLDVINHFKKVDENGQAVFEFKPYITNIDRDDRWDLAGQESDPAASIRVTEEEAKATLARELAALPLEQEAAQNSLQKAQDEEAKARNDLLAAKTDLQKQEAQERLDAAVQSVKIAVDAFAKSVERQKALQNCSYMEVALWIAVQREVRANATIRGSLDFQVPLCQLGETSDPAGVAQLLGLTAAMKYYYNKPYGSDDSSVFGKSTDRGRQMANVQKILDEGGVALLRGADGKWKSVVGTAGAGTQADPFHYLVRDPASDSTESLSVSLNERHEVETFRTPWSRVAMFK